MRVKRYFGFLIVLTLFIISATWFLYRYISFASFDCPSEQSATVSVPKRSLVPVHVTIPPCGGGLGWVGGAEESSTTLSSPIEEEEKKTITVNGCRSLFLDNTLATYGSMPNGVTLEGTASGFEPIKHIAYEQHYNHFIINGLAAYKSPLPVEQLREVLEAVLSDTRVGISLGLNQAVITYGAVKRNTKLANDLVDLDLYVSYMLFGDILGKKKWDLLQNYEPKLIKNRKIRTTIYLNYSDFRFTHREGIYELSSSHLDTVLVPLRSELAKDGGHLPDLEALNAGRLEEKDKENMKHLTANLAEYRKRPIFKKPDQFGECAAFFRYLKESKVDLAALLKTITEKLRAPIDLQVYYTKGDPSWPAADETVRKVEKLWSRIRVERVSVDESKGIERLAELQIRLQVPRITGPLLVFGPYWLMGEEKGRSINDYFAWMAARIQYPEVGKGRLQTDVVAYVKRVFGGETTDSLKEKDGIVYYEVRQAGHKTGYVADVYRTNDCPSCGDTQFMLAVRAPDFTVFDLTPVRSPERWGRPLLETESQTLRKHFLGFSPKGERPSLDAISGSTKTVSAYENTVAEALKEIEKMNAK